MEMQLQELVAELSARLPEAALAELDDLAAAVEEVEERLALLKVGQARVGCTGGSWLAAWLAAWLAGMWACAACSSRRACQAASRAQAAGRASSAPANAAAATGSAAPGGAGRRGRGGAGGGC